MIIEDFELLTIKEVATLLRCQESYVYALMRDGRLPKVKLGRRFTRIRRTDVNHLLDQHYFAGPTEAADDSSEEEQR